jgi:hypothetical protein
MPNSLNVTIDNNSILIDRRSPRAIRLTSEAGTYNLAIRFGVIRLRTVHGEDVPIADQWLHRMAMHS